MPRISDADLDRVPLSVRVQIDSICDRFESAWRSQHRPRVEDFLSEVNDPHQVHLLCELVRLELELLRQAGETPLPALYSTRFPNHARRLQSLFAPTSTQQSLPAVPGYEVHQMLGRGGMGIVYKATHLALGRVVALKMLRQEEASEEVRQRLRDEATTLARLSHPAIVQIYEVGDWQGTPYLALEFCSGGSLDQHLRGTPLAPADAARLLITLAEALQAAHDAGVVHRDLKPANVLLLADSSGQAQEPAAWLTCAPRIADFGLARQVDRTRHTVSGQVLGTPSYMAPEQARGSQAITHAVDIYALGALLYECLTGRPPFKAATVYQTLQQVLQEEAVAPRRINPAVPRDLETIAMKCLDKDPRRRYARATDVAADLRRFLEDRPILARPVGLADRTIKWARRHPALAACFALLVITILLGATWGWRELAQARAEVQQQRVAQARDQAELARTLARRGRWADSLALYDLALEHAEDPATLSVERARCLLSLGRLQHFADELQRLTTLPDLTPAHRALIALLQAEQSLAQGNGPGARVHLQQAIGDEALVDADASYARALLAERPAQTIQELDRALTRDPAHHRASAVLAQVLIATAHASRADEQIRYHRRLFPEDPTGLFLAAWQETRVGNAVPASEQLAMLRRQYSAHFDAPTWQRVETFLAFEKQLMESFEASTREARHQPFASKGLLARFLGAPNQALEALRGRQERWVRNLIERYKGPPDARHLGLLYTQLPWAEERARALETVARELAADRPAQATLALENVLARSPEAMLLYTRSCCRSLRAVQLYRQDSKKIAAFMDEFLDSGTDAYQASIAPAERPFIHRAALRDAAVLDAFHLHCLGEPPSKEFVERLASTFRRLEQEFPLDAQEHPRVTGTIATLFHSLDPALLCPLLRDWVRKAPDDPTALKLLAHWEAKSGNLGRALELTRLGLKKWQGDRGLVEMEKKVVEALTALLKPA